MKKVFFATMAALFLAAQTLPVFASVDFVVSANIPQASGVTISLTKVMSNDILNRTVITNNQMSMDPMTFNMTNHIWLPDHYFVIDAGTTNGIGGLDLSMAYVEGDNQNLATGGNGLGWKACASFYKVVGTTETALTAHGNATYAKRLLKTLISAPEHFLPADTTGGFLRTYVGINSELATTPTGAELFTTLDKGGAYSGTIKITASAV
ncbi:MAG: hypothetical protein V2A70_05315 [Candidatus Omnitrophota bacterium]